MQTKFLHQTEKGVGKEKRMQENQSSSSRSTTHFEEFRFPFLRKQTVHQL